MKKIEVFVGNYLGEAYTDGEGITIRVPRVDVTERLLEFQLGQGMLLQTLDARQERAWAGAGEDTV